MPSIDKTFNFMADAEGLTSLGLSANITLAWNGSDGVPAGCVAWTMPFGHSGQQNEKARQTTSQTWETWGVPPGGVVSQVELVAGQRKNASGGPTGAMSARVVTPSGTTVHSAGDLNASGTSGATSWTALDGLLGPRAVDASYQASSTPVAFEMGFGAATQGVSIDSRFDALTLRITYTGGSGAPSDPGTTPGADPVAAPNGGIYLSDGTYIPGSEVCGAGVADKFTLVTWMRDGHQ